MFGAGLCTGAVRADCPLQLTNFQLVGFSTIKDVQHYSVTARTQADRPYALQMMLASANSAPGAVVDVPRVTPGKAGDAYIAQIAFRWRGPAIQSVAPRRVSSDGAAAQCPAIFTQREQAQDEVGLYLDPEILSRGASAVSAKAPPAVVDARFLRRVEPSYPSQAKARGEVGTVVVLVTIGPGGTAKDVKVNQSSGFSQLNEEAARAARESTYVAPTVGGKPSTETYKVVYKFTLDTAPAAPPGPSCGLTILGTSFLGRTSGGRGLYDVALSSDTDSVRSADLAFDVAGVASPLSLNFHSFDLVKADHGYRGHVRFLWAGGPIEQLSLADTVLADSPTPVACKFNLYNVIADPSVQAPASGSSGSTQATAADLKIVSPAVFTRVVPPEYPPAEAKARSACEIRVIVIVAQNGKAAAADPIITQNNVAFSGAAVRAALASTYAVPAGGGAAYAYHIRYSFIAP